jgi:transcriptional regulator with XRE-family HTH domain
MSFGRRQPTPPTDELRERLGANLRRHRQRLGISQHEFAFRADTHITSISPLELGLKSPHIDTFIRLAGALEVKTDDLTEGILWVPPERIVAPGGFDVPDDPELAAEAEALRARQRRGERMQRGRKQ